MSVELFIKCIHFILCRFDECVVGGDSTFLDVFYVAEEFRKKNPRQFETLTQVPATFQKIHYER